MSPSLQIAPPLLDLAVISAPHTIVVPASTSFRAASPTLIWWFNLYFIRFLLLDSYLFIDSLNCIRFLLLDSYGESIMLEVGTQTKERKFIKDWMQTEYDIEKRITKQKAESE